MKNKKIILIVSLSIVLLGLGLGFAAFSTVLNISSSANVTPNSSDFSVVFSSSDENYVVDEVEAEVDNAGATGTGTVTTTDGIIDNTTNDKPKITNLSATFTKPGQKATYTFYVHNNGKYDAYLTNIVFNNVEGSSNIKTCTPGDGATPEYVSDACDGIKYNITVDNEFADTTRVVEDKLLPIDAFKTVTVEIEYESGSKRSDGPFSVNFGSIELYYNTINKGVDGVPTENETYVVTGTIIDDDGNPVSGGYAAVFSTKKVVEVGSDGTFKATGLEPGKHEVYYLGSKNPTNLTKKEIKKQASIKGTFTTNDNEVTYSNGKKASIKLRSSLSNAKYEITYEVNGGTLVGDAKKTVLPDDKIGTLATATKENYTLEGWYTDNSYTTKVTENTIYDFEDDIKLYAKWKPKSYQFKLTRGTGIYRIYYKINGASSYSTSGTETSPTSVSTTATYGTSYSYYATTFGGYYELSSCTSSSPCTGTITSDGINTTLSTTWSNSFETGDVFQVGGEYFRTIKNNWSYFTTNLTGLSIEYEEDGGICNRSDTWNYEMYNGFSKNRYWGSSAVANLNGASYPDCSVMSWIKKHLKSLNSEAGGGLFLTEDVDWLLDSTVTLSVGANLKNLPSWVCTGKDFWLASTPGANRVFYISKDCTLQAADPWTNLGYVRIKINIPKSLAKS